MTTDGSENSFRAARTAACLARSTGAKLTVLSVVFTLVMSYFGDATEPVRRMEREERARAERAVSAAGSAASDGGAKAQEMIVEDFRSPVQGIIGCARKDRSGLIVVGTRGLGGSRRLLGGVANGVVCYAACPVLVVR